ncbi:MAG: HemK2/MTQ2 family protein methyltransferase [archaeon]
MKAIYKPSEDSFLMSQILKEKLPGLLEKNPNLKFLELGAGSGIHLETSKKLGVKNIFSSDINPNAVSHCTMLGFNCVESDLFEKIKGEFDIIIFNPPYLPEDKREPEDSKVATTGGKKGNEIILRFLKDAKKYLNAGGKIFLITSTLAEGVDFEELGYEAEEIGCENLFYERLCVWELTVNKNV